MCDSHHYNNHVIFVILIVRQSFQVDARLLVFVFVSKNWEQRSEISRQFDCGPIIVL